MVQQAFSRAKLNR